MKKYIVFGFLLIFCVYNTGIALGQLSKSNNTYMIRHTVVFKLIHPKDSPEEKVFLDAIKKLSTIPGVEKFELFKQTSKKNNYDYGLSMEFETAKAYEDYNQHPDHITFVQTYWIKEVKDFLEIDFEPLK
jgi:heme-degrading monooxygenase HmoA